MKILSTTDTKNQIYLDAVEIRYKVFVEEQQVSPEIELDENEALCVHFVLYNEENRAVATARILPNKNGIATLQRMAVLKEYRKNGYGRDVIVAVEEFARKQQFYEIILHAQLTAKDFYEKMGYLPFGAEFDEAGIKHVSMKKEI
ncbi:GNAT family acetyltransferase [Bacteroidia bacterium]|nr:GNAT family acetyltransferase [Bacteroidia bacterium]